MLLSIDYGAAGVKNRNLDHFNTTALGNFQNPLFLKNPNIKLFGLG